MVYGFWSPEANFGDALTPWILEKLFNEPVVFKRPAQGHTSYMVTGSILNCELTNAIVWGCGLANANDPVALDAAEIRAVRGPLTAKIARARGAVINDVVGDPALLLPRWYKPRIEGGDLGIIPHYVDYEEVQARYGQSDDIIVIDVLQPVETVLDQLALCNRVLSSSLHGLIAAHAYGKPAEWVVFSDKLEGDGMKFQDYFMSIGYAKATPIDMTRSDYSVNELRKWPIKSKIRDIDLGALWKARPGQ